MEQKKKQKKKQKKEHEAFNNEKIYADADSHAYLHFECFFFWMFWTHTR